ncbi:MAG: NAD(P)-dependent oxidoreductase [Alphaproteobacteria bacterium CG_4_10_14_0_2_um_filter_63_37]|nr:MAG: NAD(P)-dependent oxidoreductase [Alphaproteobacteria bacterium CG_4_10_14_0_2_um_filter_63_37]
MLIGILKEPILLKEPMVPNPKEQSMSSASPFIVITGAAGHLGTLTTQALLDRGLSTDKLRLTSRDPAKLAPFAAQGAATVRADFGDAASLEAAFAGGEVLLLISGDAPNELRIAQHRAAIDAAKHAGVKRVVYTSFSNPSPASLFTFGAVHGDTEDYLKSSGLDYTLMRNNQYFENLDSAIPHALESGVLAQPGATGKVAYIGRGDIARALATVLTESGHEGKTYEIAGTRALDLSEVAAALSAASGKTIQAVDADPEQFGAMLAQFGLPPYLVEALLGMYAAVAAGEMAATSHDAERLAGGALMGVEEYVKRFV